MPSKPIPTTEPTAQGSAATGAGTVLLIATALELLAMAHHPTVAPQALPGATVIEQAVQQIPRLAALSGLVHGLLMALMLIVVYGLVEFALRRGLTRPAVRAGCIAYGAGVIVMLGAALVSGWVTPSLMILTPHLTSVDLAINGQLLTLCRVLNQSCANFGAVAMSAGIVLWSFDLMLEKGARRLIGAAGILLGAIPALALVFGLLRLNVHGATELLAVQAVWNVMIAFALLRSIV